MTPFTVNDTVAWTSQAGGKSKSKVGRVVHLVPAGRLPDPRHYPRIARESISPRNHDSVIVLVDDVAYWPRMSLLRRAKAQAPEETAVESAAAPIEAERSAADSSSHSHSFRLHDPVIWTRHDRGQDVDVEAEVVEVLGPARRPNRLSFPSLYDGKGPGFCRNHPSVVVRVGQGVHWPDVADLRPVGTPKRSRAVQAPGRSACAMIATTLAGTTSWVAPDAQPPARAVETPPLKLGDTVTWTSQAGGHKKTKVGRIEQVVPAHTLPDPQRFSELFRPRKPPHYRNHASYVVVVDGHPYWPVASLLHRAEDPCAIAAVKPASIASTKAKASFSVLKASHLPDENVAATPDATQTNAIVQYLFSRSGLDFKTIAGMSFPALDLRQFARLVGHAPAQPPLRNVLSERVTGHA